MAMDEYRPWWKRTLFTIGLEHMAHRPPLPRRWKLYCVAAYLIPVIVLETVPSDGSGIYTEMSWLATLAPAFILSLHYGMLGAASGLIAGTALYLVVMLVLNLNLMPVNQGVLVPIYVSYGALAIAVGWLSQQLHDYYHRLIKAERLAAIGEVAITIRHSANNALAAIMGEAGLLKAGGQHLSEQDQKSVETILEMSRRVDGELKKLASLSEAPTVPYAGGERKMVDLGAATAAEGGRAGPR
jgi:hypothetical protein